MSFETFFRRLKVNVTLEGLINWLIRAISPIFMHGFKNGFAQVFFLRSRCAI